MGLRPGHCYSNLKDRANSRYAIDVHERNYIGAVPAVKIRQFNMGEGTKHFSHIVDLLAEERTQIRDNSLESVRMAVNRFLNNKLGKEGYFVKIRVYPFQILRENKQAQGAGADRVSQGMSHSFGKPIGRAIRTRPGQELISILVDESGIDAAKKALHRANAKMNVKLSIRVGTDVESIGTKPKKTRDIIKEEEEAKQAAEAKEAEAKGAETKGPEAKGATAKGPEAKGAETKKADAKAKEKK